MAVLEDDLNSVELEAIKLTRKLYLSREKEDLDIGSLTERILFTYASQEGSGKRYIPFHDSDAVFLLAQVGLASIIEVIYEDGTSHLPNKDSDLPEEASLMYRLPKQFRIVPNWKRISKLKGNSLKYIHRQSASSPFFPTASPLQVRIGIETKGTTQLVLTCKDKELSLTINTKGYREESISIRQDFDGARILVCLLREADSVDGNVDLSIEEMNAKLPSRIERIKSSSDSFRKSVQYWTKNLSEPNQKIIRAAFRSNEKTCSLRRKLSKKDVD